MQPRHLDLLRSVSAPTVSPDGGTVVFALSRPDTAADAEVGQLWRVPADGSAPASLLTRGHRDGAPRFSPDGSLVAFLRAAPGAPAQLAVVAAGGGEPVVLTDRPRGVLSFDWSPDSRRLVLAARDPEHGRYGTVEGVGAGAEPPRRITTTRYRSNGLPGYTVDQRVQLFVVEVPDVGAEPVPAPAPGGSPDGAAGGGASAAAVPPALRLTAGDADCTHPRFTPDGAAVTFVAARHPGRDDDLRVGAHRVRVPGPGAGAQAGPGDGVPEPEELVGPGADLAVREVLTTADGSVFVLAAPLGPTGRDVAGRSTVLHVLRGGAAHPLTDPASVDLGESGLEAAGEGAVLVQDRVRGALHLLRVGAAGDVERLTGGPVEVPAAAAAGGTVALAVRDAGTFGDVAVLGAEGPRRLTDLSAPLRATGLVVPREVEVPARDGHPLHGWVLVPETVAGAPRATLLLVHGGPFAQYTGSLFDEAQVLAGAGYAVVMGNPRGSAGYGEAHARAIAGAMGTVDATDVLDLFDGACREHGLETQRVGVLGGSYGGYLTAWTIAHEHRFAAAIVERGYLDAEFFVGTSDIGTYFTEQYFGPDPADQRARSPQSVAHLTRTPTLVVHSEDDLRCPLSQAERYFLALRRAGVDSEMLVFPGEDHELTRSGRPRHRLQRFEAVLQWWRRHLPLD